MSVFWKVFENRPLAYLRFVGETGSEDCMRAQRVLSATSGWTPGMPCLVDHSQVTGLRGGFGAITQVANELSTSPDFARSVTPLVYFAPTDIGFGMARMVQQILSSQLRFDIHIFREENRALAHLGQPEGKISELICEDALASLPLPH